MTSCTKPIWIVTFKDKGQHNLRIRRVAAWNLMEVISHYNDEGKAAIIKIEKTDEEIDYYY